jgi:hypothetical protein
MTAFSRGIKVDMNWVDDASFEISGSLDDNVHSLSARLLLSFPDFVIREASGEITRMPYPGYCTGSIAAIERLVGERVGRGFRKRAAQVLGGGESCNHLHTLVFNMAACAFQMNYVAAKQRADAAEVIRELADDHPRRRQLVLTLMPQLRNSCFVFSEASDGLFELPAGSGSDSETGETD